MKTITFASKKGGVSKTTSALMTALLLSKDNRVLLIDLDSQNALTDFFFEQYQERTIYEAIKGELNFKDVIKQVSNNLFVIPSKLEFETIDQFNKIGKEYFVKNEIELLKNDFDYVVIDTPPNLRSEAIIGLVASDIVVIPARLEKMDTRAIDFTLEKINEIKKYYNPDLQAVKILCTQYQYQNRTVNDLSLENLKAKYDSMVLKTIIPFSSKISQFNFIGFDNTPPQVKEYQDLINEVLKWA